MIKHAIRSFILALFILTPFGAYAQTQNQPQTASAPSTDLLKPPELDALVAPIALYPDPLLTNILMAATYPLEIVQADRWLDQNKSLQGDTLKSAAEQQPWDTSVKALVATPDVVDTMSNQLAWTQKLGDAVLAQESDVMDAIQRLRNRAYDNKKLETTTQQTVNVTNVADPVNQGAQRQVIEIAPASAENVYVPYYDPTTVYGEWPYPDYASYPYYWPAPPYIGTGLLATGLAFGAGYGLGRWGWNSGYWGGNINWSNRNIDIRNGNRVEHWAHNPAHRQGVRYSNANVQQRFGAANRAGLGDRGGLGDRSGLGGRGGLGGAAGAAALGGAAGAALGRGGQNRGQNVGDRAGNRGQGKGAANRSGNRQNAANRGGNRQTAANRGGNRQAAANRGGNRTHAAARGGGGNRAAMARGGGRPGGGASMARSRSSFASAGRMNMGGARMGGMGGARMGGGGGFRGGGGGGRGGGGRRSDIRLKHDIVLLGHLDDGLGFYRFAYNGTDKAYVGVMAQEVRKVVPSAVIQGRDGYLRVRYDRLGVAFQTYDQWRAAGAKVPSGP